MYKVLLFGGTVEGRTVAEYLNENKIPSMVCVATEYGESLLPQGEYLELSHERLDEKQIAEKTGLRSFVVRKYVSQSARFTWEELKEALTACVETEEAVKTGQMNDRMSVELLIIAYSGEKERRA